MLLPTTTCSFCTLPAERIHLQNDLAVVIRDAFPVAPGHTLVIPRRHVGSFFELGDAERCAMLGLLAEVQQEIARELAPHGYTIGINDGPAAGQTVPHVHLHLIPRHTGDHPDPRGGVRWVLPGRARYWTDGGDA